MGDERLPGDVVRADPVRQWVRDRKLRQLQELEPPGYRQRRLLRSEPEETGDRMPGPGRPEPARPAGLGDGRQTGRRTAPPASAAGSKKQKRKRRSGGGEIRRRG